MGTPLYDEGPHPGDEVRPRVVVVEATVTPGRWEPMLLGADYLPAASDGINRYYVRFEDRHLLPRLAEPVSVLDNYRPFDQLSGAWGRVEELERRLSGTEEGFAEARSLLWEARMQLAGEAARRDVPRAASGGATSMGQRVAKGPSNTVRSRWYRVTASAPRGGRRSGPRTRRGPLHRWSRR